MAVKQIPNLPPVIALSGAEQLEVVQAGVSSRATVQQIADFTIDVSGTVTSIDVSGGVTGFTFTGGPVTHAGVITMSVGNQATARAQLGLGTISTQDANNVAITGGSISIPDNNFRLVGSSDATKQLAIEIDGFTTATTRTWTVPNVSDTFVGLTATQTMTNKTLTSPVINGLNGTGVFAFGGASGPGTIELGRQDGVAASTFIDMHTSVTAVDYNVRLIASGDTAIGAGTFNVVAGVFQFNGTSILTTATGQPLDATLTALAAYNTNGLLTQTAADTFTGRTITGTAGQITLSNGNGVAGNPTISLDPADILVPAIITMPNKGLHILDTNSSHDLIITPGSDLTADRTFTLTTGNVDRTLDISAASVTISAAAATVLDDASVGAMLATLGGQPVDATLTALAAYNTPGLITQTAADTFTGRTIVGTPNQTVVTNGDGVSGNPTISLDATLAALALLTITNGSFIRGTGADAFAVQSINGTVSQSGGVATGAIAEVGTNANGTYFRFTNGLQVCTFRDTTGQDCNTGVGALFRSSAQFSWTFPIAFLAATVPYAHQNPESLTRWGSGASPSNTVANFYQIGHTTSGTAIPATYIAVGWWF